MKGPKMNGWLKTISEPMNTIDFGLKVSYSQVGDLLPVAIVCGISILLTAVWVLAVGSYARSRRGHFAGSLE